MSSRKHPPRLNRVSLLVIAGALFAALAQPAVGVELGEYEHIWQAQTLYSGGAGTTLQHVMDSEVVLRKNGPHYTGTIVFSDLLGVDSGGSSVVSQESVIDLKLIGETLESGRAAGGTFEGTASFIMRDVPSLQAATTAEIRDTLGDVMVYDVQGHWGATVNRDEAGEITLDGEVIYEFADGSSAPADGPAYFNRANLSTPDNLGDAQLFSVKAEITEVEGDGPATIRYVGPDGEIKETDRIGLSDILGFILKGLSGAPGGSDLHIPDDEARAALALFEAEPPNATPLPDDAIAIDVHLPGHYLDAKNVAAGVNPLDHDFTKIEDMRRMVPGIPAMPPDQDAGRVWAQRAIVILEKLPEVSGSAELVGEIALVRPEAEANDVIALRTWYHAATALLESPFGTVLEPAAALADDVATKAIEEDTPEADAVLVAIDAASAPPDSLQVNLFTPATSEDTSATPDGSGAIHRALAAEGTDGPEGLGLDLATSGGTERIAPETWLGYHRADDTHFWLAGPGSDYAVTDASIRGWAFTTPRSVLVDSARCGRWIDIYRGG